MTWEVSLMTTWTSAGGVPLQSLGYALPGTVVRRELGGRGTATLVLDALLAWDAAKHRCVVRVDRRDIGDYVEFRILGRSRVTRGAAGAQFTATGHPRIYDWSGNDLVREVLGGRTITRFSENLTPREYFERFVFVRASEDGLVGVALRTVEFADKLPLTWDRWTRAQLTAAILEATGGELQWVVLPDGSEAVDLLRAVGADATPLPLRYGDQLLDHRIEEDYRALYTVARVVGDAPSSESERATIGENLWRVANTTALTGGRVAVELRAINSTESPIVESGQYVAAPTIDLPARYLQRADGITRAEILDSDADASTVTIAAAAPAAGERVSIVADADGTPLETIELPSAIAAYGRVVADVQIPGRGERQYLENGGHENGLALWSAVNSGVAAEYARTEFGTTISGAANGARSAGVGTGTPLALKGLPTNGCWLRQGDEIRIGATTCGVQVNAIPNSSGVLVLSLLPGLPGSYVDGTPITLVRREVRAVVTDSVAQSPLSGYLRLADTNTDNLQRAFGPDGVAITGGGYTIGARTWVWEHQTLGVVAPFTTALDRRAGKLLVHLPNATSGDAGMAWATADDDVFTVTPEAWAFVAGSLVSRSGGAVVGYTQADVTFSASDSSLLAVGSRLRFRRDTGTPGYFTWRVFDSSLQGTYEWWTCVVTAIAGTVARLEAERPWGTEQILLPYPQGYNNGVASAFEPMSACNVLLAASTALTWTHTKESRPLQLSGPYSSGATSITTKPITNIARRDWVAGDTVALYRSAAWRLVTTASTETRVTDAEGGFLYWELVLTLDTGLTTLTDALRAQYAAGGGSPTLRLATDAGTNPATFAVALISVGASTVTVRAYSDEVGPYVAPVQDVSDTWAVLDTYTVASPGASWGTTGQATVPLTAAIPAGRSYGKGLGVKPNWLADTGFVQLAADFTAGATSIVVAGNDSCSSVTASPNSQGTYGLYRVTANGGSTVPFQGNTLYAAASVQANGAGVASVPITAANTNAIADSEVVTITRPPLLPPGEPITGSAMRLFSAVGGGGTPTSLSAGQQHAARYVRVPSGSARTLIVRSLFTLSAGEWFAGQGPVVAIVDNVGTVKGWASLDTDGLDVDVAPGVVELTTSATVTESGLYTVRVYGGTGDYTRWCVHVRSMLYVGEAPDAPYTNESFASLLMLTGLRRLATEAAPRIADRLALVDVVRAYQRALGSWTALLPRPTLGGPVVLDDWDRTVRCTAVEETPGNPVAAIEVGQPPRDGIRVLGATAVLANNTRAR